jgi:hypothetical protein
VIRIGVLAERRPAPDGLLLFAALMISALGVRTLAV